MRSSTPDRLRKKANCLLLCTHAFMDHTPEEVSFFEHPLLLERPVEDPEFVQLSYGNRASNECDFMANQHARELGETEMSLRLQYELRGSPTNATITSESVAANGFVQVRRLNKTFRTELQAESLTFLRSSISRSLYARLEHLSLDEILAQHPKAVCHLMRSYPDIDVLVHEAPVAYTSDKRCKVQVATVRKDQARQMHALVRYLEGIPVRFGT